MRVKADVLNEVFVTCKGINEGSRERVGGFEWCRRTEAIFQGKEAEVWSEVL